MIAATWSAPLGATQRASVPGNTACALAMPRFKGQAQTTFTVGGASSRGIGRWSVTLRNSGLIPWLYGSTM
jgi:hypothetical protein